MFICTLGHLTAETVKEEKARAAAQNWYRHYAPENKKSASVARFSEYKHNERTAFYIYNFDQGGFVLVSANDAVTPILGYGFEHAAPDEITNEAVKGWLDNYARQIDTAFVLNRKNEEMTAKWQEVLSNKIQTKNGNSVGPLLTTTWDQGWPYNAMCPEDPSGPGGHTWAGCTATAMAQILKYWNFPEGGVGYYSYIPRFNPQYGSQSVFFNETDYAWEEMESTATSDNYEAISALMYHAGVSSDMDYSTSGSGAHLYRAVYGFKRNFDFSDSIIQEYRSQHNDSTWLQLIKSNIDNLRPVLMDGYNASLEYGHAWVCDGYDQNDYLHINWGWSGSLDGFWQFNNLFPGWFDFRFHQSAITNLFPNLSNLESRIIALQTENNFEYHFIDNALGNPATFYWDFGDSTYSEYQNPIHFYESPGNYLIKLVVQKDGIYDTVQEFLNVYRRPFLKTSVDLQGNSDKVIGVDYNNDNKHDIIISGHNGTRFYDNINNSFELNTASFPQMMSISPCNIEPVDLVKSNQPQFFLTGSAGCDVCQKYTYYFKLEEQNIVYDTLSNIQLPSNQPFSYADFNNDGKIDLLLGNKLYMNFGNLKFVYVCDIGDIVGASAWCDFNLDGFLDVAIGDKIFKNNGEFVFSDIGVTFSHYDHLEWGDFNGDGYPDLLVGNNVLLNENGINFSTYVFELNLPDIQRRVFSRWADIDNDGDLDVISLISGINYYTGHYRISTKIYNNLNNNLYFLSDDIQSFFKMSSIGWIDYDNDNNLDLLLTGYFMSDTTTGNGNNWVSNLYTNNSINNNQSPSIPENLQSYNNGNNGMYLSWDRSFDDTTPQSSLSYNVYVYNAYDSIFYVSPLSDTSSGFLKTPKIGNAYFNNFLKLDRLLQGTYYWSVQAIDNAFSASPFSAIDSFSIVGNNIPDFINLSQEACVNTNNKISSVALHSSYYDPENDTLTAIRIDSLPEHGVLIYNGIVVDFGQIIQMNDIGSLYYFTNLFTDDHFYISPNDGYNWGISSKFVFNLVLFEEINLEIDNAPKEVAWGDYNNDGYVDFSTGTAIYKNVFGSFEDIVVGLTGEGEVNWIDFDSDGDLDLFVGEKVYQNEGNDIFTQFNVFSNLSYSASISCDFNSDNHVDYFRTGRSDDYNLKSYLYDNSDSGQLTEIETNIPGVEYGNVTLADIDNSGCHEIAICGMPAGNESITQIYKYEGQSFIGTENQIIGVNSGDIDFGDFDNDGYPDLIVCGLQWNFSGPVTIVYRNNGNTYESFTNNIGGGTPFFLPAINDGIAKWVDLNSDGYLDIILGGYLTYWVGNEIIIQSPEIRIYLNQAGVSFIEQDKLGLPELSNINCSLADFDNDGFIDLLLSGKTKDDQYVTRIYRNGYGSASNTINTPPTMPSMLSNSFSNGSMNFTWNKSNDDTTPQDALSYNIYVRRNQDSVFIVSPLADTITGFRKIVNLGNTSMNNFYKLDSLCPGTYYWSVQAIDNSFAGGPFAPEQAFTIEDYNLKRLSTKVLLEGAYNSGTTMMNNVLLASDLIPAIQPYDSVPWNYTGVETITTMPDSIIDWVLVELRQAASPELATEQTILPGWPKALLLKSDGSIVGVDNNNPLIGNAVITENLYIVICHRNHLDVMSNGPLVLSGNTYTYDFTDAITKAYGGSLGYKQIASGVFGMVAGDSDADGEVSVLDFSTWASQFGGSGVYSKADNDMDGEVSVLDFSKWAINFGIGNPLSNPIFQVIYRSQIPENK